MKLVFVCGGTQSVCDVMIGVSWQHNAVSEVIATWEINFSVCNPTSFENFSMKTSESFEGIFTSYGTDSFVFLAMLLRLKHISRNLKRILHAESLIFTHSYTQLTSSAERLCERKCQSQPKITKVYVTTGATYYNRTFTHPQFPHDSTTFGRARERKWLRTCAGRACIFFSWARATIYFHQLMGPCSSP